MAITTEREFENLLDAKGPDIAAWPWLKRRAAERLLVRSPGARAALDAARHMEDAFAGALAPEPLRADLRARLDAIPLNHPQRETAVPAAFPLGSLRAWWMAGAATAMASVVAGFVVGAAVPAPDPALSDETLNLAGLVYGPSNGGLWQ